MRRKVIGGALLVAMAAGCAAGGAPDNDLVTETRTERASATATLGATAGPSPTPSPEAPPDIDLTAEDGDYRRVVEEILRFREWLFAHPHRQDLVSVIYNEDCPCYEPIRERLQAYVDANRHLEVRYSIEAFQVLEDDDLSFRIQLEYSASGRVVEGGKDVEEGAAKPLREEWFFLREPTGRYRIAGAHESP